MSINGHDLCSDPKLNHASMSSYPQGQYQDIPWHKLIQDRLLTVDSGITGVVVLSKKGLLEFTFGKIKNEPQQDWSHFTTIFRDSETDDEWCTQTLALVLEGRRVQFTPFKTTLSSVYGISAGDLFRLIICSFPLGVLVCVNEPPAVMSKAVTTVESLCSYLRT